MGLRRSSREYKPTVTVLAWRAFIIIELLFTRYVSSLHELSIGYPLRARVTAARDLTIAGSFTLKFTGQSE